jgi:hypothetical protein
VINFLFVDASPGRQHGTNAETTPTYDTRLEEVLGGDIRAHQQAPYLKKWPSPHLVAPLVDNIDV